MNKELEILERISKIFDNINSYYTHQTSSSLALHQDCEIIKKAIQEKEKIEQVLEWLIIRIRIIPREWRDSIETELQILLNKEEKE